LFAASDLFVTAPDQFACALYASNSISNAVRRGMPYISTNIFYAHFFSHPELGNAYILERNSHDQVRAALIKHFTELSEDQRKE
jgi:hypothetical protein